MIHFKKYFSGYLVFTSISLFFVACDSDKPAEKPVKTNHATESVTPILNYTIINKYLHDTTAFTEGFLFHEGKLFESTGAPEYYDYARSSFGILDLEKGKLDIKSELDKKIYFGEGIVILNNKLYQLTYTTQVGFVYDLKSFKKIAQFNYANKEGWGLTTDGKELIMSDGTFNLTYLDPETLKVTKIVSVNENEYGLDNINELEYVNGYIYANVWMNNYIVKIDPQSGKVVAKLNLNPLLAEVKAAHPSSLEMNGIAYDSLSKRFLVTGKFWPTVYEIKFDL
jgi:glutamine cyclotransferase